MDFQEVIDVFNRYFGEENVDFDCSSNHRIIYVHWPEIEVKANDGNKTVVYDMFMKVRFDSRNTMIGFPLWNKTTYTRPQVVSRYIHSHMPSMSHVWVEACYGSGPVKNTISTLNAEFDDEILYKFCWEIDKYLQVESTYTRPFKYIREIGSGGSFVPYAIGNMRKFPQIPDNIHDRLIDFLARKCLKASYINGIYFISNPIEEIALLAGDYLKVLSNKTYQLDTSLSRDINNILIEAEFRDGNLYIVNRGSTQIYESESGFKINFKGQQYSFKIIDNNTDTKIYHVPNQSYLTFLIDRMNQKMNNNMNNKNGKIRLNNSR